MLVAGGALGKDLSQERAVVLLSTSGGDSKKAGVEAAVLEHSYMLRLVKECTLLKGGGVAGEFRMGTHCCISQNCFHVCAMALSKP